MCACQCKNNAILIEILESQFTVQEEIIVSAHVKSFHKYCMIGMYTVTLDGTFDGTFCYGIS